MDHIVGDAKLGGILILSSPGYDDLEAVVGDICLKASGGSPNEFAGIRKVVYQAPNRLNVC